MRAARILGAVVLAMGMASLGINLGEPVRAKAQQVDLWQTNEVVAGERTLAELTEDAKAAKIYVSEHSLEEYPGLEKYLGRLIGFAEADVIENEAVLKQALEEAIVAVPYLTSHDEPVATREGAVSEISAPAVVAVQSDAKVADAQEPEMRGTAATIDRALKTQGTAVAVEVKNDDVKAEDNTDVELPKTGETNQIGVGGLMIAGAAVVIGTIGATLLIIRNRKDL